MRTATKKFSSLLFILLGLTPLLFILVFSLKKREIRQRMEEEMDRGSLQTVVVAEQDVIWMDKHEIWVNESMFDIRTKKLENGVYTFTGRYDHEETLLVKKEKQAAGKSAQDNKLLAQFFKSLPGYYIEQKPDFDPRFIDKTFIAAPGGSPVSPYREIVTPPPQC